MNQEVSEQEPGDLSRPAISDCSKILWLTGVLVLGIIVALGTSWYMFRLLGVASSKVADYDSEIAETQEEVDELEASLADNRKQLLEFSESSTGADLRIERQVGELRGTIERLQAQQQAQHQQMLAMSGNLASANASWQQAEIVYLLQIANERLTLARDPATALSALRAADQRLAALADPGLTPVRAQVANETQQLEAIATPDIEGTVLKLDALAATVARLTLRGPGRVEDSGDTEQEEEGFSMARAWSKLGDAFSGMVKVSKTSEEAAALLSPDEQFYLRNNIGLQLDIARLSALSRDQASYETSLGQAGAWIREYFVSSNAADSALETIEELELVELSPALPDISTSLNLMQAAIARPEPAPAATPDPEPDE